MPAALDGRPLHPTGDVQHLAPGEPMARGSDVEALHPDQVLRAGRRRHGEEDEGGDQRRRGRQPGSIDDRG